MPELPEVETVCRGLRAALTGRSLTRVTVRRPDLRFPFPENFAARLQGRRVEAVDRRAKYILVRLDDDRVWLSHLGMSGRMTIGSGALPPPGPHDHFCLETDDDQHLVYTDARRFGFMDLIEAEGLADHPRLKLLGPEPLSANFGPSLDTDTLARLLAGRATSIKAALLDQRIVAGLGNIYVSEALYRARISPLRPAGSVTRAEAARLAKAIPAVLTDAIAAGGSSLRDYVQSSGELGYFQHSWAVYDREGERCPDCRCDPTEGGGIRRIVQGGRSTYYCPVRQC